MDPKVLSTLFARARAWLKMIGLLSSMEKTGLSPAVVVHVIVAGPPLVKVVGVSMTKADTKETKTASKLSRQNQQSQSISKPRFMNKADLRRENIMHVVRDKVEVSGMG